MLNKAFQKVMLMLSLSMATAAIVTSCDEGDITDEGNITSSEGYSVRLTGSFKNMDQWPSNYTLAVAGFTAGDSFPAISKKIPNKNVPLNFVFTGIDKNVETIEICVLNRINKKVASFDTLLDLGINPNYNIKDTIYYKAEDSDVSIFNALQLNVFNKRCVGCHGRSTTPAAGLNLLQGQAYANLYKQISTKCDTLNRVTPYDADNSMLYRVLSSYPENAPWHYDHTRFFYGSTMSDLVKAWINNGALE